MVSVGRTMEPPAGEVERLNRMLASLAPRPAESEHPHLWLYAYWEPGDDWHPVERIVVAQVTPRSVFEAEARFYRAMGEGSDATKLAELDGPNPRWGAHYDQALGQLVHASWRLPPTITERQWMLWRQIGGLAQPVWIVQGEHGGTPRKWNRWERELLRVQTGETPQPPPYPGKLDYAPADNRVLRALLERGRTQALSAQVDEEWFHKPMELCTPPERELHHIFAEWYSARNEARASGKVTDATYNPASGRFEIADYTRV